MRIECNINTMALNCPANVLGNSLAITGNKYVCTEWNDRWINGNHAMTYERPRRGTIRIAGIKCAVRRC